MLLEKKVEAEGRGRDGLILWGCRAGRFSFVDA
jgi:hypothetical protein